MRSFHLLGETLCTDYVSVGNEHTDVPFADYTIKY